MNCQNAAALPFLLVYLLLPPLVQKGSAGRDSTAPLSKWAVGASYDTAATCEQARTRMLASYSHLHIDGFSQVVCVAGNDPRLAK
jgi:hypothetical protein